MNFKLLFEFSRANMESFDQISETLTTLIGGSQNSQISDRVCQFISVVDEIVKNIIDHADGEGVIKLEKTDLEIKFEIQDKKTTSFDFVKLSAEDFTTKPSEENYGLGLWIIKTNSHIFKNLEIRTVSGFKYLGIFVL